jgi:hypothetical protein
MSWTSPLAGGKGGPGEVADGFDVLGANGASPQQIVD